MVALPSKAERDSWGIDTVERGLVWAAFCLGTMGLISFAVEQDQFSARANFSLASEAYSTAFPLRIQVEPLSVSAPPVYSHQSPATANNLFPIQSDPLGVDTVEEYLVWCCQVVQSFRPTLVSFDLKHLQLSLQVKLPIVTSHLNLSNDLLLALPQVVTFAPGTVFLDSEGKGYGSSSVLLTLPIESTDLAFGFTSAMPLLILSAESTGWGWSAGAHSDQGISPSTGWGLATGQGAGPFDHIALGHGFAVADLGVLLPELTITGWGVGSVTSFGLAADSLGWGLSQSDPGPGVEPGVGWGVAEVELSPIESSTGWGVSRLLEVFGADEIKLAWGFSLAETAQSIEVLGWGFSQINPSYPLETESSGSGFTTAFIPFLSSEDIAFGLADVLARVSEDTITIGLGFSTIRAKINAEECLTICGTIAIPLLSVDFTVEFIEVE